MAPWDAYSDQPAHMRDKAYKRRVRKRHWDDLLVSALTILFIYPIAFLRYLFGFSRTPRTLEHFFGMGVNSDKNPDLTPELVRELGTADLLIRIRMEEMDRLEETRDFAASLAEYRLMFVLIPARDHVTDSELLRRDLTRVFEMFSPYGSRFQVGNAVNRFKWGFVLPKEYLIFYRRVQALRDRAYPDIRLIGPSVIDFEYHVTSRMLFNFFAIRYDALSSLLYVDRRGAPENRQFIFDLRGKIDLLRSMARLSPKIKGDELYITETNWPIEETGAYAPTSPTEQVSESLYTAYMVRYFLLAAATSQVTTVYWHQMIAPGYGLVDNRNNGLRKRDAFDAFAFMAKTLRPARFVSLKETAGTYAAVFATKAHSITAMWRNGDSTTYERPENSRCRTITGDEVTQRVITLNDRVHYIIEDNHG